MNGPCPAPERLAAALRGPSPGADDEALVEHLSQCAGCRTKLEALAGGSSWPVGFRAPAGAPAEPLRRAMKALVTEADVSGHEPPAPPGFAFLLPSDEPDLLGRFGPYEVLQHVASGGMGIVFKARDPALNRIVALKVLSPVLATHALARARFIREARAAAAVVHEHVVPIYAVDESASLPYIAMQFVHGRSLAERIRATGPLRLEEVLRIGAQTAAGLAAAHAQGLIHRDVKPGNILLENSVERVRLTDFGLARAMDEGGLTRTGELAGTPEYMSPEQAGNEAVDQRTDLFSFGSVLYAMCIGRAPFQGTSVVAVIRQVCDRHPKLVHEINANIPRWLSDIIARLMAKSPANRFQSAREVGELLSSHLARVQHSEPRLPDRARWPRRAAIGALAAAAITTLVTFSLKYRRGGSITAQPRPSLSSGFRVHNPGDPIVRTFPTLAAAIETSAPGAVVEIAINGPIHVEPMVVDHPLILRSAIGFRPELVRQDFTRHILLARSPLVVEGLVLRDSETPALPEGAWDAFRQPGGAPGSDRRIREFVLVEKTSAFFANCKMLMTGPSGPQLPAVQLSFADRCEFWNCELFTPECACINVRAAGPGRSTARAAVVLRNCICVAERALVGNMGRLEEGTVELERNTFAGGGVFSWLFLPSRQLAISARSNLFAVGQMMNVGLPRGPSFPGGNAAEKIRWREQGNFYSVQRFLNQRTEPELKDLASWLRYWGATGNGRTGKAPLTARLEARRLNPDSLAPDDFRLEGLRADDGNPVTGVGADVDHIGPGAAYDRWRETGAYAEWTRLVSAALGLP